MTKFKAWAISIAIVAWIISGIAASAQRGDLQLDHKSFAQESTILLTMLAGPFNYLGANPKVHSCHAPQPSK